MKKLSLCLIMLLLFLPAMANNDLYPFESQIQKEQFTKLTQEIRCLVCQNQAISDSNAAFASDLRSEVYHLILQNKSNKEVKDYLTQRYGEYVLFEPAMTKKTGVLWAFPVMLLIVGMLVIFRTVRNKK